MLCFAGQNVSWKVDGEAFPAGGCGTRSVRDGSWSDRRRSGTESSGVIFTTSTFKIEVSLARKLRFHIFLLRFCNWSGVSANGFLGLSKYYKYDGIELYCRYPIISPMR